MKNKKQLILISIKLLKSSNISKKNNDNFSLEEE